eukprot:COSAG01_NODE_35722_length_527_cov_2.598131_1_plen_27_part_10
MSFAFNFASADDSGSNNAGHVVAAAAD